MSPSTRPPRSSERAEYPSRVVALLPLLVLLVLVWNTANAVTGTLRAYNLIGAQPMHLVVEGEPLPGLTQAALDAEPAPLSQSPQTVIFRQGDGAAFNAAMDAPPVPGVTTVQIGSMSGPPGGPLTDPSIGVTPSSELSGRSRLSWEAPQTQQSLFEANMKLGQNVTAARATAASISTIVDGPPSTRVPVGQWTYSVCLLVGLALACVVWARARRRERGHLSRLRTARRRVAGVVLDLDALEVTAPGGASEAGSGARRRLEQRALALSEELAPDPHPQDAAPAADRAERESLELEAQADSIFLLASLALGGDTAAAAWERLALPVVAQLEFDGRHELAARVRSFLDVVGGLSVPEARARWIDLFSGVDRLTVEVPGPRLSLRALANALRELHTPVSVIDPDTGTGVAPTARARSRSQRRGEGTGRHRRKGPGVLGRLLRGRALKVIALVALGLAVFIVPFSVGAAADRAAYLQNRDRFIHPTPFGTARVNSVEARGDLAVLPPLTELRAAVSGIPVSEDTRMVVLGFPTISATGNHALDILSELRRSQPDLFDPATREPRQGVLILTVGRDAAVPGEAVVGNLFSARPNVARDVASSLQWKRAVEPTPVRSRDSVVPAGPVSAQVATIVQKYSAGFRQDSAFAERNQGGRIAGVLLGLIITALLALAFGIASLWRRREQRRAGRQARRGFARTARRLDALLLREDEAALDAAAAAQRGAGAAVGLREAGVAYAVRLREELAGLRRGEFRLPENQRTEQLFASLVADLERQDESLQRAARRALLRRLGGPAAAAKPAEGNVGAGARGRP